jgi:hypothetical protein
MENPDDEVKLAAIKKNGCAIQFIDNPTEEMQIAAVTNNHRSIEYIKNPSRTTQLITVRKDGTLFPMQASW